MSVYNISNPIAFLTLPGDLSRLGNEIILEQNGAETLLGNGDLLFKDLGPAIRLQSPPISDEDLKQAARG
jgi:DNA segregation ATPase FtsK/SpoIIIE-like protein